MFRKILKTLFFHKIVLFAIFINCKIALSSNINFIRDAESEKFLRELCEPIFKAANLDSENIKIFIVNDNSINAFVSGGQNIFINIGLIRKYKTPNALIGVMAHEVGHISGGHLARSSEEMQSANHTLIAGYLAGVAAMIAGSPEAGQALLLGTSNIAEKSFLKYNRGQEEAADQYAVKYLTKIEYPANGLLELLEFFNSEMQAYKNQINEYYLTHPISKKRIDYLRHNFANKNLSDKKINAKLQPQMDIVLAKLEAFMDNPESIINNYEKDDRYIAKYIKAIAFHRKKEHKKSIKLLDDLIKEKPRDGFLYELRAQILFESGDIINSIIEYHKAISIINYKDSPQINISFAAAILSLNSSDNFLINLAIKKLKEAQNFENENPFLYKQLSIAYYKINDAARSKLFLGEYNFLIGNKKKAKEYLEEAKEEFKNIKNKNTIKADLTRLDDLLILIAQEEK